MSSTGMEVPPVIFNTEVKLIIRGLRNKKDPGALVLFGKICGSSRSVWKIDRLNPFTFDEQREAYRQRIAVPARVLCLNSVYKPGEPWVKKRYAATMCRLIDISMTGILFSSREALQRDDWLVLLDVRLLRGTTPFVLTCQVRRIEEISDKESAYGCYFTHISASERDRLCSIIFDIQREDISDHRGRM